MARPIVRFIQQPEASQQAVNRESDEPAAESREDSPDKQRIHKWGISARQSRESTRKKEVKVRVKVKGNLNRERRECSPRSLKPGTRNPTRPAKPWRSREPGTLIYWPTKRLGGRWGLGEYC